MEFQEDIELRMLECEGSQSYTLCEGHRLLQTAMSVDTVLDVAIAEDGNRSLPEAARHASPEEWSRPLTLVCLAPLGPLS